MIILIGQKSVNKYIGKLEADLDKAYKELRRIHENYTHEVDLSMELSKLLPPEQILRANNEAWNKRSRDIEKLLKK